MAKMKKYGLKDLEDPKKKVKRKLTIKQKDVEQSTKNVDGEHGRKNANTVVKARRESDVVAGEARLQAAKASNHYDRSKSDEKVYKDEDGKKIGPVKLKRYQEMVADAYRTYVVLTDAQQSELSQQLPQKINHLDVQVGAKAVFPHVLDLRRKRVSRAKIVNKMNRLRYIESDDRRGLKLSEEDAEDVFNRYKLQSQAKKDLVRTLISLSYSDFEICEYLDIKGHELGKIKKEIFYEEISAHRQMSQEELYIQYRLQQMEVVKDIDVLVERFKGTQQLNAIASILRSKADILDKIIVKGQEFGVIKKTAEKKAILVGNVDLTDANLETLETELVSTNQEIRKLMGAKADFLDLEVTNEETG